MNAHAEAARAGGNVTKLRSLCRPTWEDGSVAAPSPTGDHRHANRIESCLLMPFDRACLLLLALLLLPAPAHGQGTSPDSVTMSGEMVRDLRAEIAGAHETLTALSETIRQASESSALPVGDGVDQTKVVNALVLVLSLVFESAMSVIFDWRIFIRHFEGRGVKTPLIVGVAFVVFLNYDLDIVADILQALHVETSKSVPGQFLTALLIAGGSSGVFRIFSHLGIRSPEERARKAQAERSSRTKESTEESSDHST